MTLAGIDVKDFDVPALAERYAEDGALLLPPVLTGEELDELRENIDRYRRFVAPRLPDAVKKKTIRYEKDGVTVRSWYFMDQVDTYFNELGNRPFFKELVGSIVGYDLELYTVETFNKFARVGSAVPHHQDCAFFALEPQDMVHLWIAIDPATADNGAVRYWPGSHKGGLLPHVPDYFGLKLDDAHVDRDTSGVIVAELPPGSAAIHSGLVVHDSAPNTSGAPRLGLLCGYRGAHTRFIRD
jgi:phytanoyl-CoA hydroxylase